MPDPSPFSRSSLPLLTLSMVATLVFLPRQLPAISQDSMMPRFADYRIGHYSRPAPSGAGGTSPAAYICRFRLEKKDPNAAVSDVVKPIVFYIDPTMPKRLVPWVKLGVEAWRPAFEAIGFGNAIVAREAPDSAQEPTWSLKAATHSAVVWHPTPNPLADAQFQPTASGEIVRATINISNGTVQVMQHDGGLLAGDPTVSLPLPDSLLGPLVALLITHETGHALGLDHNFRASSGYSPDSLRSLAFVRRMGHSASVMDYAHLNWIAQDGDGFPLKERIGRLGPYDRFALAWAYRPVPGATTPEAERATLETWRQAQDTAPYLRASLPQARGNDPGDQSYDLGSDLVKAADAGIHNFARVGKRLTALRRALPTAEGTSPPQPDDANLSLFAVLDAKALTTYQDRMFVYWSTRFMHIASTIGGIVPQAP